MKRNLLLLAAAGLLVALATGLWVTRSDEPREGSLEDRGRVMAVPSGGEVDLPEEAAPESVMPLGEAERAVVGSGDAAGAVGVPVETSPQVAGASIDRKVIQTASMSLQVKAVGEAFQEVGRIAAGAGGFVAGSTFSNEGDQQVASVTIRVPAVRFQQVLADLRGLAVKVEREESQASDVTEEFTDLASRLRNLEATEAQYLEFLKRAENIGEVLQVQDRLNAVRAEIEQVRGRMNLLEDLSDLAVATVHLRPEAAAAPSPGPGGPDPARAAGEAWEASLDALRTIASGIVVVAAFSWWLVPPMALLALVVRQALVRHARSRPQAP